MLSSDSPCCCVQAIVLITRIYICVFVYDKQKGIIRKLVRSNIQNIGVSKLPPSVPYRGALVALLLLYERVPSDLYARARPGGCLPASFRDDSTADDRTKKKNGRVFAKPPRCQNNENDRRASSKNDEFVPRECPTDVHVQKFLPNPFFLGTKSERSRPFT